MPTDDSAPHKDATATDAWSRLPDEPAMWYQRFDEFYRVLGHGRSILAAYNAWQSAQDDASQRKIPAKAPHPGWGSNSRKWRWKQRAEAWDEQQRNIRYADEVVTRERIHRKSLLALETMLEKLSAAAVNVDPKAIEAASPRQANALAQALKNIARESRVEAGAPGDRTHVTVDILISKLPDEIQDTLREYLKDKAS